MDPETADTISDSYYYFPNNSSKCILLFTFIAKKHILNYIVGKKNFLPDVIKETLYILFTSFLED